MSYAILGPQQGVNRVTDTLPQLLPEGVTAVEITAAQRDQIVAGRTSVPPVIYALREGVLVNLSEEMMAKAAEAKAAMEAKAAEAKAARDAQAAEAKAARDAQAAEAKAVQEAKMAEALAHRDAELYGPASMARYALDRAEQSGIDIPFGVGSVRMLCDDRSRALFSSALILYRTHEDNLTTAEAKEAFRNSTVVFADADGHPHQLTVSQAREFLVAYGVIYQQIWATAAQAKTSL